MFLKEVLNLMIAGAPLYQGVAAEESNQAPAGFKVRNWSGVVALRREAWYAVPRENKRVKKECTRVGQDGSGAKDVRK